MKVWITKYALTTGIFTINAELRRGGMISFKRTEDHFTEYVHGEGIDWHRTKESASARLSVLKDKKIASLKKQIEKIEKLEY